jgi:hypothetical protein
MYVARLICSDEACGAEALAEAHTLAELDTFACDCGCALAIIGWPDAAEDEPPTAAVVALGRRPPVDGLAA